jgi:hypothetical protein
MTVHFASPPPPSLRYNVFNKAEILEKADFSTDDGGEVD